MYGIYSNTCNFIMANISIFYISALFLISGVLFLENKNPEEMRPAPHWANKGKAFIMHIKINKWKLVLRLLRKFYQEHYWHTEQYPTCIKLQRN